MTLVQWWRSLPPRLRFVLTEVVVVVAPAVAAAWAVPPHSWSMPLALLGCLLLPLRHVRHELAVLGVLPALAGGLGWPCAVIALYGLGRRNGRSVTAWAGIAAVVATVFVTVAVAEDLPWQRLVLTFVLTSLIAGAPALLGMLMTARERLTASLRELRDARESAVAATREAARAQERARIGREIHDAVGHHATLIAVGAAALAASTREESTREAAEQIRALAKRSLAEMRTALGLAGDDAADAARSTEISALITCAQGAGLDVGLTEDGPRADLPPAVARAAYRVVQESLTNAARHAPGQPVRVVLGWSPAALDVAVRNAVPRFRPEVAGDGGGTGLTGLAERVAHVDGRFDAGVAEPGTFAVTATFPLVTRAASARTDPPVSALPARRPA